MAEETLRMPVRGMTCEHCERTIEAALTGAGAEAVGADFRRGEATFRFADGGDVGKLAQAVTRAGYRPGKIEAVEPVRLPTRASGGGDSGVHDLTIVGSGSAAFAAAIRARDAGLRVVMVERDTIGGTCVNVGCVPGKALLKAAEVYHQAGHHPFAGVETRASAVDLAALVDQKRGLVAELRRDKYEDLIADYGWEMRRGEARFEERDVLLVDGRPLQANAYLIATGASPSVPPIPGLAEAGYLTSTSAMELEAVPESLAVIGGNAIGLELGQLFQRLGSQVTLFEVLPRVAPFEEPEISELLTSALAGEGMHIHTGANITRVQSGPRGRRIIATVEGKEQAFDFEQVLVATGRRPNTADLNLAAVGVKTDPRGAVVVDETLQTANPRIWAAGDVTSAPQFVYVAAYQGNLAAENILSGNSRTVDFTAMPRITFTAPQIAAVGLTEEQARREGNAVKTALLPAHVLTRALVNRDAHVLFKLVVNAQSDRILGVHILGENAGDVIYAGELAVKFNLRVGDLIDTFGPYLTLAEGLKLAAQTFGRDVAKLSCCAA
jgi:mercuric reductase